jgi:hypothetical protein
MGSKAIIPLAIAGGAFFASPTLSASLGKMFASEGLKKAIPILSMGANVLGGISAVQSQKHQFKLLGREREWDEYNRETLRLQTDTNEAIKARRRMQEQMAYAGASGFAPQEGSSLISYRTILDDYYVNKKFNDLNYRDAVARASMQAARIKQDIKAKTTASLMTAASGAAKAGTTLMDN